jgi:hypothetical protein
LAISLFRLFVGAFVVDVDGSADEDDASDASVERPLIVGVEAEEVDNVDVVMLNLTHGVQH